MAFKFRNAGNGSADLYLYGYIEESWFGDEVSAKAVIDALKDAGDVKTLNVHINSYGGDVFEAQVIYTNLLRHGARKIVMIDGVAASAASFIAMVGDEIEIAQGGQMMIHNASGGFIVAGTADEMDQYISTAGREYIDRTRTLSGEIADKYVARSGKSEAEVRAWMDAETWFTAERALEAGLVDRVLENKKRLVARLDPKRARFLNVDLAPDWLKSEDLPAAVEPAADLAPAEAAAAPAETAARPHLEDAKILQRRLRARLEVRGAL